MDSKTKRNIKEIIMEKVDHPKHYNSHPSGVECIEIARHYNFCVGNAIKYIWRAGLKKETLVTPVEKEIEDIEKAIWYLKDHLKTLKTKVSKDNENL